MLGRSDLHRHLDARGLLTVLSPLAVTGPFSLVQKKGSVFEDLLIDLSKVRVRSAEELKAAGITGKTHLADIVWTVSLS